MAIRSKRTARARTPPLEILTAGTYVGTPEIVAAIVKESTHVLAWRPVRAAAAAAMAIRDAGAAHRWMTTEEFTAWFSTLRPSERSKTDRLVGFAASRRRAILEGSPITPGEALAIAHVRAGLPLPISEMDGPLFRSWFLPRFGAAERVAKVLGMKPQTMTDQMNGYSLTSRGRAVRRPSIVMVRALDWCWRVGPFSPYGDRLTGAAFPGQIEET